MNYRVPTCNGVVWSVKLVQDEEGRLWAVGGEGQRAKETIAQEFLQSTLSFRENFRTGWRVGAVKPMSQKSGERERGEIIRFSLFRSVLKQFKMGDSTRGILIGHLD